MRGKKIDAGPTRDFIVKTITKDIRIEAAIFDLIDISINAAETLANPKRLHQYYVSLKINNSEFEISDNCGGISKDKVWGDALKIGSSDAYTGGHGIGLKRAFLKFGKDIKILSNRNDYSCRVNIDVELWGKRNNWDIDINEVKYNKDLPQGLIINVSNLYDDIKRNFSNNTFINNLIREIEVRYRYKLQSGFNIIINGQFAKLSSIEGDKVTETSYKVINSMNVKIILYNNVFTKANGWDIVINGRVVIERDKSEKTLWRKKLITRGCSYEKFVGEVIIEGDNIKKLPVWSTKDGIDINSKAYENILDYMYYIVEQHRAEFKKPKVNIQYCRSLHLVETLKDYFDVVTAKDVGECSFDYTYRNIN
ncbi:ATP-binding protein [Desnuesiella massiliensis]|uniref:ATP-binding protein n=1 Tax=Desnuesiella massiliensis TaxID=1650662 RepID=UPI0006E15005|nr:ATP-binding protein [Desnuesiella massiliensis]